MRELHEIPNDKIAEAWLQDELKRAEKMDGAVELDELVGRMPKVVREHISQVHGHLEFVLPEGLKPLFIDEEREEWEVDQPLD